jgi:hypothetical protein
MCVHVEKDSGPTSATLFDQTYLTETYANPKVLLCGPPRISAIAAFDQAFLNAEIAEIRRAPQRKIITFPKVPKKDQRTNAKFEMFLLAHP